MPNTNSYGVSLCGQILGSIIFIIFINDSKNIIFVWVQYLENVLVAIHEVPLGVHVDGVSAIFSMNLFIHTY